MFDINTNVIQLRSRHEQFVEGYSLVHKDPFSGRKIKRGYVIDPDTKQEVIQTKSCVVATKLLNLDENQRIHDEISNRVKEEEQENMTLARKLKSLHDRFSDDKSHDTSTESSDARDIRDIRQHQTDLTLEIRATVYNQPRQN